jgi:hypothetical protein
MVTDISSAINAAVAQVATDFGAEYVKLVKENLASLDKLASGSLYNSINSNVYISDQGVHLELLANDYLKWVDLGRQAGTMPPVDAILQWIIARAIAPNIKENTRRNILGRFSKGFKLGRGAGGRFTSILKAQQGLAWAIAVSIKNKGIKPTGVQSRALDEVYGPMQEKAQEAAVGVAQDMLGEHFADAVRKTGLKIITTY